MNKMYQITPEEASSIYAKKFRYLGLPILLLSFVTATIYVFINLWITNQIIMVLIGTLIFASLVMYGAYFLGKKFLAPKTMTMKYELTESEIIQTFPN